MTPIARRLIPLVLLLGLAACADSPSNVRITNDKPAPPPVASRSEPIFYNGKTYRLDFSPAGGGLYNMAVSGMGPKQQKDAVAVATSSLAYFACPDGQRGKLKTNPAYTDSKWRMQARCG
jgi:hypothetical protein